MVQYRDFLRHIVNTKLSELSHKYRGLISHMDEIRKEISRAETKYGFSSFGGNPENLAKYLLSDDFNLLISSFKAANALGALEEILMETKKAYSDLPGVVRATEQVLEKIKSEKKETIDISSKSLKELAGKVKEISKELRLKSDINVRDNDLILRVDNKGSIVFKPHKESLETIISITIKVKPENIEEILKKVSELLSLESLEKVVKNKKK